MSSKRLRCLFAVADELHDYAEAVNARMIEHLASRPLALQDLGSLDCAVLHRAGALQAELIQIHPDRRIPVHSHPGVDSIDLLVSGNVISFQIWQERLFKFIPKIGLRIAQGAPHGGVAGPEGVAFLSCQRWVRPPSHITLAWRGRPINDAHEQLLEELAVLA